MAKDYDISNRKTASLLDTFSCIAQGFLPYGAQILVAVSAVTTLGKEISAFDIIGTLYYPMMLLLSSLLFIFVIPEKKKKA
jgi:Na+/H+ antiporter NhaC